MKYLNLVLLVFIVSLVGYGTYALYPRFALDQQDLSLPLLAVVAGLASFFSPCSFSLLTTLLARESGIKEFGTSVSTMRRAGLFAVALALGASVFFVLAGFVLLFGGSSLFASVTFTSGAGRIIRLITGILLIILGLMQLERLPNVLTIISTAVTPLVRFQARHRRQFPKLSFFVLGFAYPTAGFG